MMKQGGCLSTIKGNGISASNFEGGMMLCGGGSMKKEKLNLFLGDFSNAEDRPVRAILLPDIFFRSVPAFIFNLADLLAT